jgi:hypothetical protein
VLKVDTANARVGINNQSPAYALDVNGTIEGTQFIQGTDYLSPYQGFRNKIINGGFEVWQRGGTGGYSPTAGAMEGADRWFTWWNGTGGTRSVSRSTFALGQTAVPDNPKYHMTINTSVIGSGQSVTDFWQKVENVNTFAGQTATLSFWFKSTSAATQASPFITQNFGTGGSPSTAVDTFLTTVSVSSANTWTRYSATITLPSISGKTLGTSGDHIMIGIRFLTSVACTIDLSSVQLEQGSVATPFEQRPIGTELALCQRYYQKSYTQSVAPGTVSQNGALTVFYNATYGATFGFQFRTTMRAAPSITLYSQSSGTVSRVDSIGVGDSTYTLGEVGDSGVRYLLLGSGTSGCVFHYEASSEL